MFAQYSDGSRTRTRYQFVFLFRYTDCYCYHFLWRFWLCTASKSSLARCYVGGGSFDRPSKLVSDVCGRNSLHLSIVHRQILQTYNKKLFFSLRRSLHYFLPATFCSIFRMFVVRLIWNVEQAEADSIFPLGMLAHSARGARMQNIDVWLALYIHEVWSLGMGLSWFLGVASCKVFCSTSLASFPSTPSHETTERKKGRRRSRPARMDFFYSRSWESRTASGVRWMLDGACKSRDTHIHNAISFTFPDIPN